MDTVYSAGQGDVPALLAVLPPGAEWALVGAALAAAMATVALAALARRARAEASRMSAIAGGAVASVEEAERTIDEMAAVYRSLVETLPQSFFRKDLEGRFIFANQRFCDELGRPLDEVIGRTDFDFFPRELAEKYRGDDELVLRAGRMLDVVERHVTPGGETMYVQVMKTPLYASDGVPFGVQAIFWDVTARVRGEEELRRKNAALEDLARSEHQAHEARKQAQSLLVQTEKLASLGQLVAGVAHEINNPLAFVSNNVAVLERDLADLLRLLELLTAADDPRDPAAADEARRIAERIDLGYCLENFPRLIERTREGLRRIERIVKELRLFARVDDGDWNEVDLNPGVESSVAMVKGYARSRGVRIDMDLAALPTIRCSAARVHQVILNLLTNAIDACGEDGRVVIRTAVEPDALGVRVEVDDDGAGIPRELRDRLFDPFFTTKAPGRGTGLGLSISYGIIQEHRGRIEVESTVGRGSRFTVHLPLGSSRSPLDAVAAGKPSPRPAVAERTPPS